MKKTNSLWRGIRPLYGLVSALALLTSVRAETINIPAGYLSGTNNWKNTNTYVLQGFVYVVEGGVLRIEPGTVIKGVAGTTSGNFGNLFIAQGAKIYAEGTPQNPIIFTAEEDDVSDSTDLGAADTQLWGGVILFGKARINNAVSAAGDAVSPKYDIYEGLPDTQAPGGQFVNRFGGADDEDSSGVMRYVSIRHGGKLLESNKEVNGLSVCGVGRGTTLEYIEVFANSDDGFEFFGGSVNTRYLVSAFNQDEQFDADQGYNGKNQFWFGIQPENSVEKGMEINGEPQDRITGAGVPVSNWEVYNATLIGAGARAGTGSGNNAFTFRANTQVKLYNGIFTDFNGQPITGGALTTGATPTVQNTLWWNFSVANFAPAALFETANNNSTNVNPLLGGISRTADLVLDPRPQSGSPANTSSRTAPNDGFYRPVAYYGAFTSTADWAADWTALGSGGLLNPAGAFTPVVYPSVPPTDFTVQAIPEGNAVRLTITGGTPPYLVQGRPALSSGLWIDLVTTAETSVLIPLVGDTMYFQVQDQTAKTVALFRATLNGANERPTPVETPASGSALFAIEGLQATYLVSYQGLKATSVAAHLHGFADAEGAAGVLFGLIPAGTFGTSGILSGVQTLTAEQLTGINSGQTYVNIHSAQPPGHSGGEIRGQLVK